MMATLRVLLVFLTASPVLLPQQSEPVSKSRLRGRPLVFFVVSCDPRLAEFGLTQDVLMKDVELIFRRNHVALAEKKEDYPKAGLFSLTVDVVAIDPTYSIFIRASFAEDATVLRTGDRLMADVWSNGWQYIYGRMMVPKARDNIKEAAENFALDYLRENP